MQAVKLELDRDLFFYIENFDEYLVKMDTEI